MKRQRLYKVRVERSHEVVVIACDEEEAEEIAYETVADDDGGLGPETLNTDATTLTSLDQLPHGWDRDSLPYGKDDKGERFISAIVAELANCPDCGKPFQALFHDVPCGRIETR